MKRVGYIAIAFLVLGGIAFLSVEERPRRPNILLFIGDDIDFSYYGFQGHEYAITPSLDQLASEGVVFENGFATASVCQASLRSLLAGVRSYTWDRMAEDIRAAHPRVQYRRESAYIPFTLPRLLGRAGYATFAGGKMWEGTHADAGFDAGTIEEVQFVGVDGAEEFGRDSMQELFDFIDAQTGPWFAWVAPMLPHYPFDPPEELMDLYRGKGLAPGAVRYFGSVTRMDRRIGDIRRFLDERGLTDDTVILYVGDNGWEVALQTGVATTTIGLDRGKLSVHDRGFRTPVIVRWPAEVEAGRRDDRIVTFEDVFETILDYARASSHECSNGASFRGLALGDRRSWPRRQVAFRMANVRNLVADIRASLKDGDPSSNLPEVEETVGVYLRRGTRWAYSAVPERGFEALFDLRRDPMGGFDVSEERPVRVRGFRRRARRALEEIETVRCPLSL